MSKPSILVTGANGQLGKELQLVSPLFPSLNFVFYSKDELSIQDSDQVRYLFGIHHPKYCVNCAAYTAVDRAESESELAMQVNGDAVETLAKTCNEYQAKLIHISTDYVFDGSNTKPYIEEDETNPINVYGKSKLKGEKLALESNEGTIVIRTSWVYSSFGKNFVRTMMKLMKEKESISVVNDQIGSPTYAADLAELVLFIISSEEFYPGIYHFSNEGAISWYEFALAIKQLTGSQCLILPISNVCLSHPSEEAHEQRIE